MLLYVILGVIFGDNQKKIDTKISELGQYKMEYISYYNKKETIITHLRNKIAHPKSEELNFEELKEISDCLHNFQIIVKKAITQSNIFD